MGFPSQEYLSELPFPSPEDLPDPGIKPVSLTWQAAPLPLSHLGSPLHLIKNMNSNQSSPAFLIVKHYRVKPYTGLDLLTEVKSETKMPI